MMKKIFFVLLFIFVCTRSFAQFPILSDIYDDYEFSITPAYQTNGENIFYNNGTDVEVEISERIKIKFPNNSGCNFCYGPNVTFPIFFEDINGNRHLVGEFLHNYFANYSIEAGKIYSKYYLTKIKFKPEIMALGKGKIYFGVYEKDDPTYKTAATAHILKTRVDISFIQVPKFIGPSQVCSEANYTIERPGTITLENAAGIATLTSLGNNQWKVTRIGGSSTNGTVKLRSTVAGKSSDYDIVIGGGYATSIQGPSSGHGGEMFEFTMEYVGEGTIKWKSNSTLVDMSFGDTGPNLLIGTAGLLHNQKNKQVLIEGIFTSSCGVVTQISKTLTLNP